MNFSDKEFTLLSKEQTFGSSKIDVIERLGVKCAVSDFAILLGGEARDSFHVDDDSSLKGRIGWWYLSSVNEYGYILNVSILDDCSYNSDLDNAGCVRPVLPYSNISDISANVVRGRSGLLEVEYGEYPQYAVDSRLGKTLDDYFSTGRLKKTGKTYTINSNKWDENSKKFNPVEYEEFVYNGKKYVRVKSNCYMGNKLSNGVDAILNDIFWLEVSPIAWYVDEKSKMLISKTLLASGIIICYPTKYMMDFKTTEMYKYLNMHFAKDIIPSAIHEMKPEEKAQYEEERKQAEKRRNPYGFKFGQVSEEEIIRGAIESGVAVFLHGPSSENKFAILKQIDPTCKTIYLRNSTLESLSGKSVYDEKTGDMFEAMPSWLRKLKEKCEEEPDRLHVVFFDEITNALPSIQGIAFHIALDRGVNNGAWKLPENARIVVAGNDMKDSLAANQLAEPLLNKFAHVYIKTTTESWLKWASENNIHPAIYAYIAFKRGEALRSIYDGEKPNADPRKWEMASKMLYSTGRPEMLRALVGEDITKEFVQFCNQQVITLDDVINENYTDRDIKILDTAERYATTMGLSRVDDANLEKVRSFVTGLGAEFVAIFDALWTHGDESKLERLAEAKLAEMPGGGIRK